MVIIGKVKKLFTNLRIRKKLFVSFILIAFIPMSIILFMAYSLVVNLITDDGIWSIDQVLSQVNSSITSNLSNLEAVSNVLYANKDLQEFLSHSYKSYPDELSLYLKIDKRLMEVNESSKLNSVKIFSWDRNIYSQGSTGVFPLSMIESRKWFKEKYNSDGAGIFFEVPQISSGHRLKSFYLVRPMKEFRFGSKIIAFLQFEVPASLMNDVVDRTKIKDTGSIFFTDEKGSIIAHKDAEKIGDSIQDIYKLEKSVEGRNSFIINENGKKFLMITRKMDVTGWSVYGVVPMNEVVGRINFVARNIILALFIVIILSIYISNRIAKGISRPILLLTDQMMELEEERFVPIKSLDREDEIGMLYMSYNRLIFKIQQLIKEVYESDIKKREAEYKALKSQINPHFLYNTLDSIHWLAMRYKAREISTMVNSLAKFYRISISKGREYITIAEELQHAESYIKIQNIRYEGKIDAAFDIDDTLLKYYTISIIIQPLIENAIIHGIEKMEGHGIIKTRLYTGGEDIVIEVEDNGIGCNPENLNEILKNSGSEPKSGYGIINVHERIRLYFGEKYGLTYLEGKEQGICARVKVPKVSEEAFRNVQVNHCR